LGVYSDVLDEFTQATEESPVDQIKKRQQETADRLNKLRSREEQLLQKRGQ
jgi:hypothetical protein